VVTAVAKEVLMATEGKRAQQLEVEMSRIEPLILTVRGQKIIMDQDLAGIYGVETRRLNEQVKRNADRFPEDFVFRLTKEEAENLHRLRSALSKFEQSQIPGNLKSQFAISKSAHGGRRKLPYAFTEHGAIMAANVLRSPKAIRMSVFVVRAFVRMRRILASHRELASKLDDLEKRIRDHDEQIVAIFEAIRQLMTPPDRPKKKIGFEVKEPKAIYGKSKK
jgi:hypothetical protein